MILTKCFLTRRDRNKGKSKKIHNVGEMREMVQDESESDADEKREKSYKKE